MMQSMTGFGKAVSEFSNKKVVIEVKSLNSKQLDLYTKINYFYRSKELEIRNLVQWRQFAIRQRATSYPQPTLTENIVHTSWTIKRISVGNLHKNGLLTF